MKNVKLPFEITQQIQRYLKEMLVFNDEFLAENTGEIYTLQAYISREKSSYRSEFNNEKFWKYLKENGVIKMIGKPKILIIKYTDIDKNLIIPKSHKFQILNISPIEQLWKKMGYEDTKETIEIKERLSDSKVTFDDDKAIIRIDDTICQLPPFKNEHFFCRAMFEYPANEPVGWDVCYEKMTGYYKELYEKSKNTKNGHRMVFDTVRNLNKRIQEVANVSENLFICQQKTIRRVK